MALMIRANTLLTRRSLKIDADGVTHVETAFCGGRRQFGFSAIDCILLSPEHVLSFQVGNEVFTVPIRPGKPLHQKVLKAFVTAVRIAHGRAPLAVPAV